MDFDATSLYPSAMYDENSVYSKIESGFAFIPYMNDVYVETFNNQILTMMKMKDQFQKKITIHQILYFNIYQLKEKKHRS